MPKITRFRRRISDNISPRCEPQLICHAAGNMNLGNDKAFLIKVVSQCLHYIGYPRSLNAIQITTEAGDLILYQGNAFVIYYASNSWNFTGSER